jgi:diazepam-binding inhibitor (GABA receptor modulator, acyl-CoA-binding protein)
MTEERFHKAADSMKKSNAEPKIQKIKNEEKLELYAFFKQGTTGDINIERPGTFSLSFEAKAKWDAWNSKKGLSKE